VRHKLPRRTISRALPLLSGTAPGSTRIPRGTARTAAGVAATTLTIPAVYSSPGSTLVLMVCNVTQPANPPAGTISAVRGAQSFTVISFAGQSVRTTLTMLVLNGAAGAATDLVISDSGTPTYIAAFVSEIYAPVPPPVDVFGVSSGTGTSATATSGVTTRVDEIAIAAVAVDQSLGSATWGSGFLAGQLLGNGASDCNIYEGYRTLTARGAVTATLSGIAGVPEEWAMGVVTIRTQA
jgi:hypothetical protein